jgi:hypothetical protein
LNYQTLDNCVACGGQNLSQIIDLGYQPLANDFLPPGTNLETFPLALNKCDDCFHGQISIAVNPERMFREYNYVSGTSQTLYEYFEWLREEIFRDHGYEGMILDIGSNDGTFLSTFNGTSWTKLGVDPAINLIREALRLGVITIPSFFTEKLSNLLSSNFDVVIALNVFAHTAEPLDILLGIKKCLDENGIAYIQTSQANMFQDGEFDTVYHEHISFFCVRSMRALLKRAGLSLIDVDLVPIHGTSYLWKIGHEFRGTKSITREQDEINVGLYQPEIYNQFRKQVEIRTQEVNLVVEEFRRKNYIIASYGAAAKGNTFINYAGLRLDYIFDDTVLKIGNLSPAGGCIVSSPTVMSDLIGPILIIIPAWNFKKEIIEKIKRLRNNLDDEYLVYYPALERNLVVNS